MQLCLGNFPNTPGLHLKNCANNKYLHKKLQKMCIHTFNFKVNSRSNNFKAKNVSNGYSINGDGLPQKIMLFSNHILPQQHQIRKFQRNCNQNLNHCAQAMSAVGSVLARRRDNQGGSSQDNQARQNIILSISRCGFSIGQISCPNYF